MPDQSLMQVAMTQLNLSVGVDYRILKSARTIADLAGAKHITVPFDLLISLSTHPLSVQTVEHFNAEGVGIHLKS